MELKFVDEFQKIKYKYDLMQVLGRQHLWSEYALSYDLVLKNTVVYKEYIEMMVGDLDGIEPIQRNKRLLDLGAGTGNISLKLASKQIGLKICAVDNNYVMIDFLRTKSDRYLVDDEEDPGIMVFKQDISSLFGFRDEYYDYIIMNNVLYSLLNPKSTLVEAYRVMALGGEIRISGPMKDTDLTVLFESFKLDLEASGCFDELQSAYDHVRSINEFRLAPFLYGYDIIDVENLLREVGFSNIIFRTDDAYAGQAMIVCARK